MKYKSLNEIVDCRYPYVDSRRLHTEDDLYTNSSGISKLDLDSATVPFSGKPEILISYDDSVEDTESSPDMRTGASPGESATTKLNNVMVDSAGRKWYSTASWVPSTNLSRN